MYEKTAYELCKSFDNDTTPDVSVLFNYKGLYKKGVTAETFHKCYLTNRLDELIHKKYTHKKSGYYNKFVEKKIIIGNTYEDLRAPEDRDDDDEPEEVEDFEIFDDDHCPSCNNAKYYTDNYITDAPPDCPLCFKMICKLCSHFSKEECANVCNKKCT